MLVTYCTYLADETTMPPSDERSALLTRGWNVQDNGASKSLKYCDETCMGDFDILI